MIDHATVTSDDEAALSMVGEALPTTDTPTDDSLPYGAINADDNADTTIDVDAVDVALDVVTEPMPDTDTDVAADRPTSSSVRSPAPTTDTVAAAERPRIASVGVDDVAIATVARAEADADANVTDAFASIPDGEDTVPDETDDVAWSVAEAVAATSPNSID